MRYYYDTEFIEDGSTIDLISVGIVAEDGREYYAISREYDASKANPWVVENVLNKLDDTEIEPKDRSLLAAEVRTFIVQETREEVELWGYYSAYDHVALCQLYGTMMELPPNVPMYTRDIKQWCDQLGNPQLPEQGEGEHNALADAKWNKTAWEFLDTYVTNY